VNKVGFNMLEEERYGSLEPTTSTTRNRRKVRNTEVLISP